MLYIKNRLNKYFGFTKREYNALLAVMLILLIISILPYFLEKINRDLVPTNNAEKVAIQKLILIDKQYKNKRYAIRDQVENLETATNTTLFAFDPNLINLSQWQKLGLSAKQAQAIINYTSKGGKFYKPQDLQKMYTISPKKYKQLEPYIQIEHSSLTYNKPNFTAQPAYAKKEPIIIEINNADTLQLDKIKGIGAAFAKRIINYREKVGGFYKKEQLLEVYGLDSLKYNEIKNQITVNPNGIRKININTAEFDDLKTNPYLKYKQINAIIQYRKQHGKYNTIDDLKKILILTPQNISNLTPYLIF